MQAGTIERRRKDAGVDALARKVELATRDVMRYGLGLLLGQRKTPPPPQSTRTYYHTTDAGRTQGALPAFLARRWPVLERPPFAFHGRLQRLTVLLLPLHASSTSVASRRQEPSDGLGQ
ncbi:hypothetical protein IscW_ISCW021382 [Ixodes scapularis]|uniref:Uncharacterized protein n=1 Tax=Ixodes scapularis TaxID=6945 RepID=B7Q8C5_IXOSC|nr:hypothetical protein IscW_ISCW021382 [Ixodes scapularis]|eukprot:XP_002412341.1 hypothetical protein IscW_ISCW021382 [Ixodes scapularis]